MKNWYRQIFSFLVVCFLTLSGAVSAVSTLYPLLERDSNGNGVAVWIEIVGGDKFYSS